MTGKETRICYNMKMSCVYMSRVYLVTYVCMCVMTEMVTFVYMGVSVRED